MLDRRSEPRLLEKNSVAVTIISSPETPQLEKETFFCSTADVSVGGVRLQSAIVPPVGARLRLLVALASPARSFVHAGRVAWRGRRGADGRVPLGIQFSETADKVLREWRGVVERKLQGAP